MNDFEKHSAGAIVRHHGKFESLLAYSNQTEITQEFREIWVTPYYMKLNRNDGEWISTIKDLKISDDIIFECLGDFNWRSRSTGSFFASIKNKQEFTDIIGTHLLKSELANAGSEYAVTLSFFNSKESIQYLNDYLDYYLFHPELYFDQRVAMSAIKYLDKINNTQTFGRHIENWRSMLKERKTIERKNHETLLLSDSIPQELRETLSEIKLNPNIDFEINTNYLEKRIETIKAIANKT